MAGYDGEIRINTKIDLAQAQQDLLKLQNQMNKTAQKIETLSKKMKEMETAKVPTEEYKEVQSHIISTRDKLGTLNEKMEKYIALGKNTNSNAFKSMQYDAAQLENTLTYLEGEMRELKASGRAFMNQTGTDAYKKVSVDLQNANGEMTIIKSKVQQVIDKERQMNSEGGRFSNAIKKSQASIKQVTSALGKAVSKIKNLATGAKKSSGGFSNLARTIKSMVLSMAVFQIMSKGMEALKFGLQNLAVYSKEYNKSMSELKSSTAQLKNALAVAFQPVLNVVIPILTKMVNWINAAANAVSRFFAILGGKSTYTKAIGQNKDYAASLDKVGNSAEEAKGSLASYDELNVMQKNNSSSGGGSSDGADGSGFVEEAVGEISDWTQSFKDAIEAADWYGVGSLVAQKLNEAISSISFDGVGEKIAEKVNAVIHFLNGFLRTFDFKNFGVKFGEFANEITIAIQNIDWGSLADTFSAGLIGIFDFLSGFLETVDWVELGLSLYEALVDFISNIDWAGISDSFFEFLGAALGAIGAFIGGIVTGAWEDIQEAWDELVGWWKDTAYEDGEFTMEGLLEGIWEKIKAIGTWIKEHIFDPFIKGFKKAFGIEGKSSNVLKDLGEKIITGLKNGLTGIWDKVKSIITNFKDNIKAKFLSIKENAISTFESMKDRIENIFNGIWNAIKGVINSILGGIESMANGVITGINNVIAALNNFKVTFPDWVPLAGGNTLGFTLTPLNTISIPKLANGGVTTGSTLANIGEAGKEAVIPLERNTEWMNTFAEMLAGKMGGTGAQTIDLTVNLDGNQVYKRIVQLDREFAGRTGYSQFAY